jgi:hypothetical protein
MLDHAAHLDAARQRALIITESIRQRSDLEARRLIEAYDKPLDFEGQLEELAIPQEAWQYIDEAPGHAGPRSVYCNPSPGRQSNRHRRAGGRCRRRDHAPDH